jgi:hypothetical protein
MSGRANGRAARAETRREDQWTAIAGLWRTSRERGLRAEHFPDPTSRWLWERVLEQRVRQGRDADGAAARILSETGERRPTDAAEVLRTVLELAELDASMREHELDRNARALLEAHERRRLEAELERACENREFELTECYSKKLRALDEGGTAGPRLITECFADIEEKPLEWLWPGWIPAGCLTLLSSAPKCGKSTLTASIAARVSTGAQWPRFPGQDDASAPLGRVLFVSFEDSPERTILPRLRASGADLGRIETVRGVGATKEGAELVDLSRHFSMVEAKVRHGGFKLVIVDPIMSAIGGRTDAHKDNEVRGVLGPFVKLCEETGAAMVLVTHTHKKANGGSAIDSPIGSRAFAGIVRSVLAVEKFRAADGERRGVLLSAGANLARPRPGLVYRLLERDGNEARVHLEWIEEFDGDADDWRREQLKRERQARQASRPEGRQEACTRRMLELVNERAEPWPSTDLDAQLRQEGHSPKAVERARSELNQSRAIRVEKGERGWLTLRGENALAGGALGLGGEATPPPGGGVGS